MVKIVPEESAGMNPHIPESVYPARLAGVSEKVIEVEDKETKVKEQLDRWEWVLGVRAPDPDKEGHPLKDMRFTVLTSAIMTTKSKAFGFAKALCGGESPELGVEFDTDDLVGEYAMVTVKDKTSKDNLGNIQVTSQIVDLLPLLTPPTPEIKIEGLMKEEADDEPAPAPAPAPAQPASNAAKKKGRK